MAPARDITIAQELRQLAARIEQDTRESRSYSVAWSAVAALTEHLTARARIIEQDNEIERLRALMPDA